MKKTIKFKNLLVPLTTILLFIFLLSCSPKKKSLPYLGEHIVGEQNDTTYYSIPDFSLTNQDSSIINQDIVDNKIYVSYFFFTSCPATCPVMTEAMKRVYKLVGDHEDFMVLAHTVDPKRDTPAKLKEFSIENEINKDNWQFLTEDNDYIYDLGMNGYYLSMGKHDTAPGGFIHSSRLILVDKERHIRGMFEGTDAAEVAKLIESINTLLEG